MTTTPPLPNAPNVSLPDAGAQAQNVNPSNRPVSITEQIERGLRRRIPMSLPTRKLEVPELPGYWLHWFLESNVPRAMEAGYEFVDAGELPVPQFNPGNAKEIDGNMDMGTRVRQVAGKSETGGAEFHVLMKLREDWAADDRRMRDSKNAAILQAIFRDERVQDHPLAGDQSERDRNVRYVKTAQLQTPASGPARPAPLFQRPPRKRV
jgi:hypothetical protein